MNDDPGADPRRGSGMTLWWIELRRRSTAPRDAHWAVNLRVSAGWLYAALIVALCAWTLHSFLQSLLAACVTAVASWPLYTRFVERFPQRIPRSATTALFTGLMSVFVLAPLIFAVGALLTEAHGLLLQVVAADERGFVIPDWLQRVPGAGPWAAARLESELAQPGGLLVWAQRADLGSLLGWAQSLGQFMARHLFIISFTILLLFFLYQQGESLAHEVRRSLRRCIGDRAEGYLDLAVRAVRASVNSMLIVALFDGFACGAAYAAAGVPRPAVWAAITGSLALVPFLGYVAVAALTLKLLTATAGASALLSFWLASSILFVGDKVLRPAVSRGGTRLPFVWVLMGCLGGFEVLGIVGLVLGPVVLTLARELWMQRTAAPTMAASPGTASA